MTTHVDFGAQLEVDVLTELQVEVEDGTDSSVDVEVLVIGDAVSAIELQTDTVEIITGIQGPPGAPGPAGDSSNLNFEVTIAVASRTWEGDHTLGFTPGGVQAKDQTGKYRTFVIDTLTDTHYKIEFFNPMIGTLILS